MKERKTGIPSNSAKEALGSKTSGISNAGAVLLLLLLLLSPGVRKLESKDYYYKLSVRFVCTSFLVYLEQIDLDLIRNKIFHIILKAND